jgi:hypothetical protein
MVSSARLIVLAKCNTVSAHASMGYAVVQLAEALRYKPKRRRLDF